MRLAHADTGSPPVVVLIHGFPLSREMWVEQLKAIGSTYRVIAPDLRGHGESECPDGAYTMDEMADDVVELLDRLEVREPVVLGGLSMGGYVALSLVVRHPERVRGLILIDTRAAADTPEAARVREETARRCSGREANQSILEAMVPRLFGKTILEKHPQRVEPLLAVMERTSPQGVAGCPAGHGGPSGPEGRPGTDRGSHTRDGWRGRRDLSGPRGPRDRRRHPPRPAGGDSRRRATCLPMKTRPPPTRRSSGS